MEIQERKQSERNLEQRNGIAMKGQLGNKHRKNRFQIHSQGFVGTMKFIGITICLTITVLVALVHGMAVGVNNAAEHGLPGHVHSAKCGGGGGRGGGQGVPVFIALNGTTLTLPPGFSTPFPLPSNITFG
ncbi:uncharacterized protein LOC143917228 [Arctopsyche grandis]|uniref:uncharacterized protein LOC143917228 n=1 Tax=Arctopsyche grandis TaxID=121162 RepID=UPI00406D8683